MTCGPPSATSKAVVTAPMVTRTPHAPPEPAMAPTQHPAHRAPRAAAPLILEGRLTMAQRLSKCSTTILDGASASIPRVALLSFALTAGGGNPSCAVLCFAPPDQLLAAAPLLGPRPQHLLVGRRQLRSHLRTGCGPLRPHLGVPSGSPSSIRAAALLVGFDLSSAHLAPSSTSVSPLRCPLRRLSYRSLLQRSLRAGLLAVWVTSPPTGPALVFTAAASSPPFAASPSSWAPMYPVWL
jgi:hypothetical protein